MIFLPGGGPGTQQLRAHADVRTLVCNQAQAGRYLAAICAAPLVLGDAGLLANRKATCFPSSQKELAEMSVQIIQDRVVRTDNIFTSRGPGSAAEFGFALLAHLVSQAKSDEVRAQMQFLP
jgi:4-methyl-5(b-hydroxyethyl)-thiazole monophosphate biosynthesis